MSPLSLRRAVWTLVPPRHDERTIRTTPPRRDVGPA